MALLRFAAKFAIWQPCSPSSPIHLPESGLKWTEAGRGERNGQMICSETFCARSDCEADKAKKYEGPIEVSHLKAVGDEVELIFN